MAPLVPDPTRIRAFASAQAFETWLAKHHADEPELWLKIHKKAAGLPTVTYAEALDVALCFGWIDGIRKSFDHTSFLQRFTPRRARSIWSQINRDHVARLIAAGRMTAHGLREIDAAKADGRWAAAYAPARTMTIPDDLMRAIEAVPKALKTFQTLSSQNRFALAFRLGNLKTAAGRANKIATFVTGLARGETLHPQPSTAVKPRKPGKRGAAARTRRA
ncbi:MAG: YdeI/OmpD-associated family protein [Kofleriaceae bacterium]